MHKLIIAAGLAFCIVPSACSPLRHSRRLEREVERSAVFSRAITGFVLLDAESGRMLANVYGDRYFTPASNTKILTLAVSLLLLSDTVPSLQVQMLVPSMPDALLERRLVVRGLGDPSFLHPHYAAWQQPFEYLRQQPHDLWLYPCHSLLQRFGPGWAWDDYLEDFQPERGYMPIYSHLIHVHQYASGALEVWPPRFRDSCQVMPTAQSPWRPEWQNRWILPGPPSNGLRTYWLPFAPHILPELLADTLGKAVDWLPDKLLPQLSSQGWQTLRGAPLDTLLRRMMHQSDNFIAEQLLLMCAQERFGQWNTDSLTQWILDSVWAYLPQRPRWVDGSGLSRYNLISPQDLTLLLRHLWQQYPRERLFSLFPAGGRDGTLARGYAPAPGDAPWLFAKTGTLSGVHCLSGYLIARSGRVLIFSFMHTNFVGSSNPWRAEMERLLRQWRERY